MWSRALVVVLIAGAALASGASAAQADVVLEWNEIAQRTVASVNPLVQSRSMAIVQAAVADAVAALAGRHGDPPATAPEPSPAARAAVVAAAHAVLVALHPGASAALDAAHAASLGAIPDGPDKAEGVRAGKAAAGAVLDARTMDGWNASVAYASVNRPGRWVPTPPAFAGPLAPHWARMKPFVLKSADQFRAAPPPAPDSEVYARDLREVFEMGGATSARRAPEQADAARFWIVSAMQTWNPAARQVSTAKGLTLARNARLLGLLNVGMADALVACWDSKFVHDTWRPVTVIRAGLDGIGPDAAWTPLIVTPPFPAYPSGHACAGGAARAVLERFLGPTGHTIRLTSATAPGVTFTYDGFKAMADQVDEARVCGGIHVRHDQTAGAELGRRVGEYVCRHAGPALRGPAGDCRP